MNKLQVSTSKTLKLTNVLKCKLSVSDDDFNFNAAIEQMQSFIKAKGAVQIGPLVQYTTTVMSDEGELDLEIVVMLQCNNYIHHIESPYSMESVIRVPNAMYCRYIGPEGYLKFAYDKINIEAFEQDIKLGDSNYTIYVSNNEEEDVLVADIFVPIMDDSSMED